MPFLLFALYLLSGLLCIGLALPLIRGRVPPTGGMDSAPQKLFSMKLPGTKPMLMQAKSFSSLGWHSHAPLFSSSQSHFGNRLFMRSF